MPAAATHAPVTAIRWADDQRSVVIIDQRRLPGQYVEWQLHTLDDVCAAISTLAVRGAPAIGIAGAMGMAVATAAAAPQTEADCRRAAAEVAAVIRATRPTAVNLPWALQRMLDRLAAASGNVAGLLDVLRREATAIHDEDRAMCRAIGLHGATLLADGARVLTHCNAGALATGGIGTALAPLYVAAERGMALQVYADETRPLLQGSRLTAWELTRAGIPVTVLPDGAAASLMAAGQVDCVIVGADRIAANGDVANKIGTFPLAIAARHHGIPFYVAAPASTFDPHTATGSGIVVEQRHADEVSCVGGVAMAPPDATIYNPAFDVTPAALVTAIVSDRGIHYPPFAF
jgi:methylthioribose-1-phosphate isomerase